MEQLDTLSQLQGLLPITPQALFNAAPDAHWVRLYEQTIVAYCSLWWQNSSLDPNHRLGLIGHYAAQNTQSAQPLLEFACQQLANQGCTRVIAPIDGNTWQRYRLITERGTEPPFFLEPDHPDDWGDHFRAYGFTPVAQYSSALNLDLTQPDSRLERVTERLTRLGVTIRSLHLHRFEAELQQIHALCLISFRHNFLYSPIDSCEFIAQYRQIQPYVQPELVLLAEHQGNLVGFLFAIPDLLQAQRGEPVNTVIIKTVAILSGKRYAGLGNLLVAQVQTIAHQLGYTRAIHALMHDANHSRNLSDRYAHTMRRYALFGKALG